MFKGFAIILAVLIAFPILSLADTRIVTIQSMYIKPYEAALDGFESACSEKRIRILLSEAPRREITKIVNKPSTELIVAVGLSALDAVAEYTHLPVLYCMVLPQDVSNYSRENMTGVLMQVPSDIQLGYMLKVLPGAGRIGLPYDPKQSSQMIAFAQKDARPFGIELMVDAVDTPRNISIFLSKMAGRVDALWLLPDITVIKPRTMELFSLFSLENRIPLVAYSDKYLDKGAFMSIVPDPADMGRQLGEMADEVLSGSDISTLPPVNARTAVVTINKTIADKFGIDVDEYLTDSIKVVD